ncbi:MAG: mechanosensitive ion channel domain-containing protein [Planctomycetota bacterium]
MLGHFAIAIPGDRFDLGMLPTFLATLAVAVVVSALARRVTLGRPERGGYRGQLALFLVVLVSVLAVVVTVPLENEIRKELFQLVGIVLSAAVALSSTTFLGNLIAGGMLRTVSHFDLGDWIRVGDHFGRVTERGLLHTEIQTADRDLTTLPNLLLATEPVKVVRQSGTIVQAEVGLGYDVPHARVEEALLAAAAAVGLTDPYVAVDALGDYAVMYRVAGKLAEVDELLSRRSRLRRQMLDELHERGIEIMSPAYHAVSQRRASEPVIPGETGGAREGHRPPEAIAFDKADRAKEIAERRATAQAMTEKLAEIDGRLDALEDGEEREQLDWERARISGELKRMQAELTELEAELPEQD